MLTAETNSPYYKGSLKDASKSDANMPTCLRDDLTISSTLCRVERC